MTENLSWNSHVHKITSKANKLLGLLRRTRPLLTDIRVRHTLYCPWSNLSYAMLVSAHPCTEDRAETNTEASDQVDLKTP